MYLKPLSFTYCVILSIREDNTISDIKYRQASSWGRNPAADETMVIYDEPRSMAGQATSEDVSAISVSPSLLAAAAHYPTDASGI